MERIDVRSLTMEGRQMLRRMVVRLRKQSGMRVKELAKVSGAHPTTIKGWLARARKEGENGLEEKRRGRPVGACRKLTLAAEAWIRDQIVQGNPQQLKMPFALWTRPAIRALIRDHFGVDLQERLIGKYLKRWGFTPQRPVKRALEQNPEAVRQWLEQDYPRLRAQAAQEGAVIYWGDETAVKEDAHWVRGYAPRGQTPVLAVPARWTTLSMISAISPRGEVAFQIVEGSIDAERFIAFLAALIQDAPKKIYLVVDNLRVHHAKVVTAWLADKKDRIELAFLPPYAPESNPDEYLNRDFKTALRTGAVSTDKNSLLAKATAFMQGLRQMPHKVASYFRHPAARYAMSDI
uniref:IS630 family transposase n=1 Tax=Acidithiobacillus sulfuriphilus TaxID=1867749 RepID=A0A3M8S8S2_9PROT|nr:IS630 family transposase [Acidithiobacillus sulfuriphilus]